MLKTISAMMLMSLITAKVFAQSPETTIEKYLRDRVNDESKFEMVSISKPIPLDKAVYWTGGKENADFKIVDNKFWKDARGLGEGYSVKFRASNALGAKILAEYVAFVSNGKVLRMIPIDDFREERPRQQKDPFMQEFLQGANQQIDPLTGRPVVANAQPQTVQQSHPGGFQFGTPQNNQTGFVNVVDYNPKQFQAQDFRYWKTPSGEKYYAALVMYQSGQLHLRTRKGEVFTLSILAVDDESFKTVQSLVYPPKDDRD